MPPVNCHRTLIPPPRTDKAPYFAALVANSCNAIDSGNTDRLIAERDWDVRFCQKET
jgi:hypothetical protein